MKKAVLVCLALVFAFVSAAPAPTGREIMDKADAVQKPDTVKASVMMFIIKGESSTEKAFDLIGKKAGNDDKVLITFTKPTKIKFLTHTHKSGDDDQWLMMSSGKVKRIASGERSQPFVNSHLSYEDMKSRDLDAYTYTLVGDAQAVGADCYKVAALPKDASSIYSKAVFYVRKADYFIVRIDIFKDGVFLKFLENYDIKMVDGILTPYRSVMTMADGKGRTELRMKSIEYNKPVADSVLNKEALR